MQQICDYHLRFIRFICVDNQCQNKMLCDDCQKLTNEHANHKVIDTATFMNVAENFLKGGQPDFVLYGADLGVKTKIFLKSTQNIRQEVKQQFLKKLEDQIDKYHQQMIEGLVQTKKLMVDFIHQQIEDSFSQSTLSNRDSGFIITEQVINAINARISTKEANQLLCKLHTGELEKDYYQKKIQSLVEFFQNHTKSVLDPMTNQVSKYLSQFYKEMEKLRTQVKDEHFQSNKTNMITKSFRIKDVNINQNLQMKQNTPQYIKLSPLANSVVQTDEDHELKLSNVKLTKSRQMELMRSLDFTNQTQRTHIQHQTTKQNAPQSAQFDPSGQDFKRIITVNTQHTQLLKIIHIHKNIGMSVGKEGTINIFSVEFGMGELSIVNHQSLKPHQEIKDVELCMTPGMFITTGRNIKIVGERYVDLGYTVKLFLYQNVDLIEQISEFRDLHPHPIEQLKFISEGYLRQRVEQTRFSNEIEFATVAFDNVKIWKFSYDSSKIYEGEMVEQYKIEIKGMHIRSLDFSNGFTIIAEKTTVLLYNQATLIKQFKVATGKDQVVRSKLISNNRLLIMSQQGHIHIFDLLKVNQNPILTNQKDPKPYEPFKINSKKFLRGILFEKEEKELELIDCYESNGKLVIMLHSSQYDHFLILNKSYDLENKQRFPPTEIRCTKLVEMEQHTLMFAIEGKSDYCIWDVSK